MGAASGNAAKSSKGRMLWILFDSLNFLELSCSNDSNVFKFDMQSIAIPLRIPLRFLQSQIVYGQFFSIPDQ
jgi:hypothetical protein